MCQAKYVRATGLRVNERGMLIVELDDARMPHVVVNAAAYPKMQCVSCSSNVLPACSRTAHDIMTEDSVIPLDFKRFPEFIKELGYYADMFPLELGNLHRHLTKEDHRP